MEITGRAFKIYEDSVAEEHIFPYLNRDLRYAYENGYFRTGFYKKYADMLTVEITIDNWDQKKINNFISVLSTERPRPTAYSDVNAFILPVINVLVIRKSPNKETGSAVDKKLEESKAIDVIDAIETISKDFEAIGTKLKGIADSIKRLNNL